MKKKVFGYLNYDLGNELILTTYTNEYQEIDMDIRVYKLEENELKTFCSKDEEIAVLLLNGEIKLEFAEKKFECSRRSVFLDGPYAAHVPCGSKICVEALELTEIMVLKAKNDKIFEEKLYTPKEVVWNYSCKNEFNNAACRRVNTIFDIDICPESKFVLGEVLNDPGSWSGYPPHRHPQTECYYFLFDHPEGFGASFVGDEVYKSVNRSFSVIPGGQLHPQVVAPGYQMYTCWIIKHHDNNPWLQTDRCEDDRYSWLHYAKFDEKTNSFKKGK